MKSKLVSILFVSFLMLFAAKLNCQTFGKIIPAKEANVLFGPIVDSVKINASKLDTVITGTDKSVMFLVKKSKVMIKGDKGKIIYNQGVSADSTDVFNVFSKSMLKELLLQDNSAKVKDVKIERRSTVTTISTADQTLEFGIGCPPICE